MFPKSRERGNGLLIFEMVVAIGPHTHIHIIHTTHNTQHTNMSSLENVVDIRDRVLVGSSWPQRYTSLGKWTRVDLEPMVESRIRPDWHVLFTFCVDRYCLMSGPA